MAWLLNSKIGRYVGLFFLGLAAFFGYGQFRENQGTNKAKADRAEANAKAGKDAKDNRHELETSDDQRITDILTGRVRE